MDVSRIPLVVTIVLPFIIGPLIYLALSSVSYLVQSGQYQFWKAQPWPGIRRELFPGFRAKLRTIKHIREICQVGHKEFSKNDRAFAMPLIGSEPWMVIPPSSIKEMLNKPDTEINAEIPQNEHIQTEYTQGPIAIYIGQDNLHFEVVRRQLTRKLPQLTVDIYDELRLGFEEYFGTNTIKSKTINVYPVCMKIVTRAANRVFAGIELCRNETFLEHSRRYSQVVFTGAMIIRFIPQVLRPVLAPLIRLFNSKNERNCKRIATPIIKDRLYHTIRKQADSDYIWIPPVDTLQWLIEDCVKSNNPKDLEPDVIALRLLMLNMVAIHTTSMVITNAILDLYSSPRALDYVAGIRDECTRVTRAYTGQLSKNALNELLRIDSTIRESMRCSDLNWLSLFRMVSAPEGVTLHNNIHIPCGVRICVASCAIHKDPDLYPKPYEFNAFRFSDPREEHEAKLRIQKSTSSDTNLDASVDVKRILDLKNTSLVTTTTDFLAFGHGRHACPGRFFAAQEMKLMLAYLIMNYDIEPLKKRPEGMSMAGLFVPSNEAKITFRRRYDWSAPCTTPVYEPPNPFDTTWSEH